MLVLVYVRTSIRLVPVLLRLPTLVFFCKIFPKWCFLHFLKNFVSSFSWKQCKMKNYIIYISPQTLSAKFWFSRYRPNCSWTVRLQDSVIGNISRKKWGIKLIFCMEIIIKVFFKLILSFLLVIVRYTQSTQNNNFAIIFSVSQERRYIRSWFLKSLYFWF